MGYAGRAHTLTIVTKLSFYNSSHFWQDCFNTLTLARSRITIIGVVMASGIEAEKAHVAAHRANLLAALHKEGLIQEPSLLQQLQGGGISAILGDEFAAKEAIRRSAIAIAKVRGDTLDVGMVGNLLGNSAESQRVYMDYLTQVLTEHKVSNGSPSTHFRDMVTSTRGTPRELG